MFGRHRRTVLSVVGAVLVLWLLAVGWELFQARSETAHGIHSLDAVRNSTTPTDLLTQDSVDQLDRAESDFGAAHAKLAGPLLLPLRIVPFVGRQIRSTDHLLGAARDATAIGRDGVDRLRALIAKPVPAGAARVQVARQVAAIAASSRKKLVAIDPGGDAGLLASLRKVHDRLVDAQHRTVVGLDHAEAVAGTMARLLAGPHRYLLVAANNAEMRAGSGMFLSAAPLEFQAGRLAMGAVRPTRSLILPKGTVPVTGDLARNWSWLDPSRDLRNLALTPDFPTSGALAIRMWSHLDAAEPVEGVVSLDVDGVRDLLDALGPVTVDGTVFTSQNVRTALMFTQYEGPVDQNTRTDELGRVARALVDRLETGHWPVSNLASALVDAVQGRHLLVWSSVPADGRAWHEAGADGRLDADDLAVSILNRGANKLDQFVTTTNAVTTRAQGGRTAVTVRITLANTAHGGLPRYVGGPNEKGLVAGDYAGIVSVNAPGDATGLTLQGGAYLTMSGRDGPTTTVGAYVRIPAGTNLILTAHFTLPGTHGSVVLVPSARIPPEAWTINGAPAGRERKRTVHW